MVKKHRKRSKIKREHGMIDGLENFLIKIEPWPEIKSILTGRISAKKGAGVFSFKAQYPTQASVKCLAKNQGSVQEVFLVSDRPQDLMKKINQLDS